ncbi:hypothetical protein Q3F21_26185, partial [Brevibacillus borstelensis]
MEKDAFVCSDKELAEIYKRNVDMVYRLCYMYLKNTAKTFLRANLWQMVTVCQPTELYALPWDGL